MRLGLALKPQATALRAKVDSFLRVVKVLPFDAEDARASATLRAALDAKGQGLGPFDALIAGVAVAKELVLVTSNLREFARVKALKAESWR
jgi:tRNA(fMet)-specific endonuclease VapC